MKANVRFPPKAAAPVFKLLRTLTASLIPMPMNTNSEQSTRSGAVLLGAFYLIAFIAAAPLSYAGTLWLGAAELGWRTQVAAGALLVGWLALALGAALAWKFFRTMQRPTLLLAGASSLVAGAAYAVAYVWGGRMLI